MAHFNICTNSLMSDEGIFRKIEEHLSETQFGFRNGIGTREVLVQRARDVDCDVYVWFIDFEKTFNMVMYEHLIEC